MRIYQYNPDKDPFWLIALAAVLLLAWIYFEGI